jgi:hypothetical protein
MIDSNNQFNTLSRSLIEAARTVMEKKKNKHGHDAVGHEDEDIDNDGDVDGSDKYLHNRRKAIAASMKKEEVEEIDETTTEYRRRYQQIAKAVLDRKKKGKPSAATKAMKVRREKGMRTAGALNQKDFNKRVDAEEKEAAETEAHIVAKAPKILAAHGYQAVGQGGMREPHTLYVKHHPEHGLITHVKLKNTDHPNHRVGYHIAKFGSSTGWQSSDDQHNAEKSRFFSRDEKPTGAARKDAAEQHFTDKLHSFETYHKAKALEESTAVNDTLDMLDEAVMGTKSGYSKLTALTTYNKHHGEIHELLKGITAAMKAHKKDANSHSWGPSHAEHMGPHWGHVGDLEHYRSQLQNIHDSLSGRGQYAAESVEPRSELSDQLTESEWNALKEAMRGRPRKNPLPPKKMPSSINDFEDDEDEEPITGPEPNLHIMNQVRKAADSGMKPFKITFRDDSKHPVTRTQARRIMHKYAGLKPAEKEKMQDHLAQSHANFLSHL